jgi:cytoskeletal protein CcmA (bactofilin family)
MSDQNQNGCLTIGEGVSLSGNFKVPDIAFISGTVDGELSAREILIGATGVVKGKVSADIIDVRGEIHQEVVSKKSLLIRSTGKVSGNITYVELEIEKGGDIQGTMVKTDAPAGSGY